MPNHVIDTSENRNVKIFYNVDINSAGDYIYLQSIRSGLIYEDSSLAKRYKCQEELFSTKLEKNIPKNIKFDIIIMPPSSRDDAKPYFNKIKYLANRDISDRFSRISGARSADQKTTFDQLRDALKYEPKGDENTFKSLLIVDDIIASGKTIDAVVNHLRSAGLPQNCTISAAAPLWIRPGSAASYRLEVDVVRQVTAKSHQC